MPAQMYVMAFIGTVAAAILFKEFVYEPHIAPNVERWAEQFIAHRQARRRQREGLAVPVRSQTSSSADDGDSSSSARSSIELENLVAREVDEWRTNVNRSQPTLRHRKHTSAALDSSNISIPYTQVSPTHILFDPLSPITPSEHSLPRVNDNSLERSSSATLRSPDPPVRLLTPNPPLRPLSPGVLNDASIIASYEVAVASDSSRSSLVDLDLVSDSPFSSRAQSPFAALGVPPQQGVPFEAPISEMDFLSDSDGGSFIFHSASNLSVDGSVNGDDVQSNHWDASSTSSWASAVTRSD